MKLVKMTFVAMLLGAVSIEAVWADIISAVKKEGNSLDEIKLLVSKGADVNVKDEFGNTALMEASLRIDKDYHGGALENPGFVKHSIETPLEIMKYLISKGADINAKNKYGRTALMYASGTKLGLDKVKLLIDSGGGGFFSFFSKNKGIDINAKDDEGKTALIYATNDYYAIGLTSKSKNDELAIVKYLVSKGADVNIKDNDGKTALDYTKYGDVAEFLMSKGAKRSGGK